MKKKLFICFIFSSILLAIHLNAEEKFLSLKKNKVNVRYGPSFDFEIKYIYKKINLPLKQIDEKENWRRIIDLKNNSGWIHSSQLNEKSNSIIILKDKILFKNSSNFSKPVLRLQKGRLLILKKCEKNWCNVKTDNYSGWIKTKNIWGSIR
jgi:SH3-like domain-containing protein|tara:strand:+ start:407 stop:859 length:453 start_codon:yes stop_codon:yes gene_type:complete